MAVPLPYSHEQNNEPIIIRDFIEAALVDAILKEDGIPHYIKSYHDRAYAGIFQAQRGWGCVVAPAEFTNGIRALLAVLRSGEAPDEEEP
jgi:hypothetical protein